MVERSDIKDHRAHLKQLMHKANSNKPDAIKELVDYLMLSRGSE